MSDMGDMYKAWDEQKKQTKRDRQVKSTEKLLYAGVKFESNNRGRHLIIRDASGIYDFWPSTGKWNKRGDHAWHNGIDGLVKKLDALGRD